VRNTISWTVGLAAVVGMSASCYTNRTVAPAQLKAERRPEQVWVTLPDKSTMLIKEPELAGDTLIGMVYGEPERVPLSTAVSIRARQSAPGKTIALAVGGSAAMIGLLVYLQSRPDVGGATKCYYSLIGTTTNPCCQGNPDSLPTC
jgi:hypothetical protein